MKQYLQHLESLSKASALMVACVLLVVVGLVDFVTGVELSFSILYLLPVALATWYSGRRAGMVMAIVSGVVWFLADLVSSVSYTTPIVPYWNATVMSGFFLVTALILSTLKRTRDRDDKIAREIQERLLPAEMPRVAGCEIAGAWRPAQTVSGDYYDVIRRDDDTLVLCIGDVAGHGIPSALLMSNLQAAVRILGNGTLLPRDICAQLNAFLFNNTTADKFITFFYAIMDVTTRVLKYTNAGHNRPLILRKGGEVVSLSEGGFPLGLLPDATYAQGMVTLQEGDLLFIYTDGLPEAQNAQGEQFGETRMLEALKENHHKGATPACDAVLRAVSVFSREIYQDDVTLLVLSVHAVEPV
jgi:Stage II sporulation protein E (SpoIIE)